MSAKKKKSKSSHIIKEDKLKVNATFEQLIALSLQKSRDTMTGRPTSTDSSSKAD